MSGRGQRVGRERRLSRRERRRGHERVVPPPAAAPPGPGGARTLRPFVGPAVVAATGLVALWGTWRTWPDVIVDFGREVYLAWRLAAGDTLYVDARHFSGPLSSHLNALWFLLFGPGVMTLALANLVLAAGFVALVYWLLVRLTDRFTATVACVFFVVSFGCAQYTVLGNYNWICPYSHELTHGVMLAVAGLACVARHQDDGRLAWVAVAGLAAGLIVLTKVETMVAGIPAILLGLGLAMAQARPAPARIATIAAVFAGAAILPLAATWAWFAPVMTPSEILTGPLGHWRAVTRGSFTSSSFYRQGLGIDDVPGNVGRIGVALAGWAAVTLAAVLAGRVRFRHPLVLVALFAAAAGIGRLLTDLQWAEAAARPLPVVVGIVAATAFVGFVRHRREAAGAAFALAAAAAVFALGMLAKMALSARLYQYGFVLAAPAAVVAVAALLGWLPAAVGRAGGQAPAARAVVLGFLAAAMSTHVATTKIRVDAKVHAVGSGPDQFWSDARGVPVRQLLDQIAARVGRDETLLVFPEGVFVSYLARRRNPTPYYLFDRTTLVLWGEADAVRALAADPPDWVALVDRGLGGLSAHGVFDWIRGAYRPVWQFGRPAFTDARFSVMLMQRADGAG